MLIKYCTFNLLGTPEAMVKMGPRCKQRSLHLYSARPVQQHPPPPLRYHKLYNMVVITLYVYTFYFFYFVFSVLLEKINTLYALKKIFTSIII
jgi:hypothetical protein